MTEVNGNTIGDAVTSFLDISRDGGGPVDFIQAVAGEALIQANTDPSALNAEEHAAVEELREFAGQAVIEANLRPYQV